MPFPSSEHTAQVQIQMQTSNPVLPPPHQEAQALLSSIILLNRTSIGGAIQRYL